MLLATLTVLFSSSAAAQAGYNKDVRPILSENCFACHGPDSAARQAGLRLDRPGWSGKKLLERVLADEMPPASTHKTLSAAQKATLRRWVQSGAAYEKHWSFVSPSTSSPLLGSGATIDALVSERLKKEGQNFSPEAPREDWLRRVSLDLTGLPPTLSEIDQFLQDQTPQAYEKVVDRLLKSPHFGETMATPWLDLARYGDSYGYQSDLLETVWPYRDWVVSAFNKNLPYDQFLTRQLAGDLLPNATNETRLATAFNRLHRMTNEGGSVPEEWRTEAVADRVKTFGTAFLGLTLECARCHDHKFDPVTQKDYYRISAFFSSIDEHGLYDAGHITPTPSLLLPTREQVRTLGEAREAVAQAERALVLARRRPGTPSNVNANRLIYAGFETLDGIAHAETVPLVEGKVGKAIQLDGENNVSFPGLPFTRHTPFSIAFYLKDTRGSRESVVVYTATDGTDTGPYGYDLTLQNGILTARMMRHWPGNAIAVRTKSAVVPKNTWIKVMVTYDGSSQASGLKIWVNNQLSPTQILKNKLYKGIGTHTLTFGQRFRDKGFQGGLIDEVEIYSRATGPGQDAPTPEAGQAEVALSLAREKIWRAEDSMLEVMTMEELPAPRPTYTLTRGAYDAEKTEKNRVTPGTPEFLPPLLGARGNYWGPGGKNGHDWTWRTG